MDDPFPGENYSARRRRGFHLGLESATADGRALDRRRQYARFRQWFWHETPDFFCQIGGYDLHTGQTEYSASTPGDVLLGAHSNLLAELSQSLYAFQRAMEQLGLSNKVTSFTASDFGRTFPSNGQGSDHGCGSHHLILGGAVKGQRTYGTFPVLTVNGPNDTSTGRWIPTTAIDQYFATLATWFGVDSSNLSTVFPNLGRFTSPNLGFI